MELEQAMENRRSIRKYEAKPVETEKIRKMIQAAGLAPSWKNSQVTRYYVAQSEEAVAKVGRHCRNLIGIIRKTPRFLLQPLL